MRVDSIATNLRALVRANTLMADIHARHLAARSGLFGLAGLVAAFGLVMLGIAALFALEPVWGRVWAAVAVGGGACVLAAVIALIARIMKPGHDLELARHVHQAAVEGLMADGRALETEVAKLREAVTHPFDQIIPAIIVPLAGIVLNMLKRRDAAGDPPA